LLTGYEKDIIYSLNYDCWEYLGLRDIAMPKISRHFSWKLLLIGAIAAAILLRIINLDSRELWYDEVLSVLLSTGSPDRYNIEGSEPILLSTFLNDFQIPEISLLESVKNLLREIASDVHPPLFYLSLHLWRRIFGTSDLSMHALVALFSVGAIVGAYGLGKSILGKREGLILTALFSLNPFFLYHSLNLRMYSPLLFFAILSAWAMVELVEEKGSRESVFKAGGAGEAGEAGEALEIRCSLRSLALLPPAFSQPSTFWSVVLTFSITAGMLTQYLFAYWVMTLSIFALIFDRRRWWLHGLRLGTGVLFFLPWFFWGTKQQLSNRSDVFRQLSSSKTITLFDHLRDVAKTLATHLLLGESVTKISVNIATALGIIFIILFAMFAIALWQRKEYRKLGTALVFGIVPLLLALAVDIAGKKLTVGFGEGRSLIFILPGCLLLAIAWIETVDRQWQKLIVGCLLVLYLSIGVANFSWQPRWMFHQLADIIKKQSTTPTLIAMNSNAWGHVLRLAYYTPADLPVSLIAQKPADLASKLKQQIQEKSIAYPRLIWIDLENPVWSKPKTENERLQLQSQIQQAIESKYRLVTSQNLSGTTSLDNFTANIYQVIN
jgi:uncharacterized membrane protein